MNLLEQYNERLEDSRVIEVTKDQYDKIRRSVIMVSYRKEEERYWIYILITGGKTERQVMSYLT